MIPSTNLTSKHSNHKCQRSPSAIYNGIFIHDTVHSSYLTLALLFLEVILQKKKNIKHIFNEVFFNLNIKNKKNT